MVDLEPLLRWAAAAVGPDATVTVQRGLREGSNPWLVTIDDGGRSSEAVLKLGHPDDPAGFRTEVAALSLASERGIPAPRLLASDLDGTYVDKPVLLETVVPGSSQIPVEAAPERLRATGACIAPLRTIAVAASAELPLRARPISASDFAAGRRDGTDPTTPLLAAADERIQALPTPDGDPVLVHGDLWQGNLLWHNGSVSGIIDWDMAGVGHPSLDLAALRLDAVLLYGSGAEDLVLDGWQQATGCTAEALPYWDAVAALNMPGDMALFEPVIRDQGRTDLTADTLNDRRDTFLRQAIAALT
ncbi:phosphotransferase family protein [Flindersiella endophytica]